MRLRSTSSCSRRCGAGRATTSSCARCASPRSPRSSGSTRYGDRDGDGFVEYERRTPRGLENQSWKDSWRLPALPRRHVRSRADRAGRGAGLRLRRASSASPSSRGVWDDRALAERLEREAVALRVALRRARSGSSERGGYYALALDGDKRPSTRSARTSGTCSGAVSSRPSEWTTIANALLGDELWSGWGIRTMSTADAAYNPLSYHNGTVWPHDTSLIAWGLARAGRTADVLDDRRCAARGGALLRPPAARGVRRATRAARRRSRSPTRPPRGRRRGPPARRCCCSACCSGSDRPRRGARSAPLPPALRNGSKGSSCRGCARSAAPGTSQSRTDA